MSENERRDDLRGFLRERRAYITPDEADLTPGSGRVQSLRREEVATTAGIGISCYTSLEHGAGSMHHGVLGLSIDRPDLRGIALQRKHVYHPVENHWQEVATGCIAGALRRDRTGEAKARIAGANARPAEVHVAMTYSQAKRHACVELIRVR
jgi:hypothetical protein